MGNKPHYHSLTLPGTFYRNALFLYLSTCGGTTVALAQMLTHSEFQTAEQYICSSPAVKKSVVRPNVVSTSLEVFPFPLASEKRKCVA
jgi:hypothetical protein